MPQEQFIRSIYDAVSSHDFEKFTSFFADDAQFMDMPTGRTYRGKSEIRAMADSWLKGITDLKLQVSNVIGSGDAYSVEFKLVGTHNGPLEGPQGVIPASGKKVNVPSCDVIRIRNGKVQSLSCYIALPVLLSQVGVMPLKMVA